MQVLMPLFLSVYVVGAARIKSERQAVEAESESVPAVVSDAIRRAKANAKNALDKAREHEAAVKKRKEELDRAADEKAAAEAEQEQAAKDAQQKAKEAAEAAKVAAQAAREAIASQKGWAEAVCDRENAQDKLQAATEKENKERDHANAEIAKLRKKVADAEAAMGKAKSEADAAGRKEDELRIAHEAAQKHNEASVQELKAAKEALAKANDVANEKALAARVAGREAEEAKTALETAKTELFEAQENVRKAKALKDLLWDVYDAIEYFYHAISDLTRAMRRSEDDCTGAPHECLVAKGRGGGYDFLETVLKNYNNMVLSFMKVKELYPAVHAEIKDAGNELENNAMAQVKLSCDPTMALENAGNAADFDKKCGDGLWDSLGLVKNRFF